MENDNIITELELMHQQMDTLKTKLNEQQIINDKLLKQSMKSKMGWIKKFIWIELLVLLPFVGIMFAIEKFDLHYSWWSYGVLMLFMVADVLFDYRINVMALKDVDYEKDNLVQTAGKLLKMKHYRKLHTTIGLPLATLVLAWMGIEVYFNNSHTQDGNTFLLILLIACIIGFCIGLAIGLFILHKMQKTNDELIRQMKEITEEQ